MKHGADPTSGFWLYCLLFEARSSATLINAKIGYSSAPACHLDDITAGCMADPDYIKLAACPSREIALRTRSRLYIGLAPYRLRAEWFEFAFSDKLVINTIITATFASASSRLWPLKWVGYEYEQLGQLGLARRAIG